MEHKTNSPYNRESGTGKRLGCVPCPRTFRIGTRPKRVLSPPHRAHTLVVRRRKVIQEPTWNLLGKSHPGSWLASPTPTLPLTRPEAVRQVIFLKFNLSLNLSIRKKKKWWSHYPGFSGGGQGNVL